MSNIPAGDPWKVKKPEYASSVTTIPEQKFITDDSRFIAELIAKYWSLGLEEDLNIGYVPEAYIADGRVGYIYVSRISRTNDQILDINYRNLARTVRLSIKIGNRFRDRNMMWAEEVTRILLAWRRAGQHKLNGWSWLEVSGDQVTETQGWYTSVIEVKLQKKNQGIESAGFGLPEPEPNPARTIGHGKIIMHEEHIAQAGNAPAWEQRMFAPMGRRPYPRDSCDVNEDKSKM